MYLTRENIHSPLSQQIILFGQYEIDNEQKHKRIVKSSSKTNNEIRYFIEVTLEIVFPSLLQLQVPQKNPIHRIFSSNILI